MSGVGSNNPFQLQDGQTQSPNSIFSGGIFGGTNPQNTQTTQNIFGNQPQGRFSSSRQPTGLFGSSLQQQQPTTGLFSNIPTQTSTLFGNISTSPKFGSGPSLFGNLSTPQQQQTQGIFGNLVSQTTPSTGLFGTQNTQQQQQQQQQQTFGGGLFGSLSQPQSTGASSIFGTSLRPQYQQQYQPLFSGLTSQPQTQSTGLSGKTFGTQTPAFGFGGGTLTQELSTKPQQPTAPISIPMINQQSQFGADLNGMYGSFRFQYSQTEKPNLLGQLQTTYSLDMLRAQDYSYMKSNLFPEQYKAQLTQAITSGYLSQNIISFGQIGQSQQPSSTFTPSTQSTSPFGLSQQQPSVTPGGLFSFQQQQQQTQQQQPALSLFTTGTGLFGTQQQPQGGSLFSQLNPQQKQTQQQGQFSGILQKQPFGKQSQLQQSEPQQQQSLFGTSSLFPNIQGGIGIQQAPSQFTQEQGRTPLFGQQQSHFQQGSQLLSNMNQFQGLLEHTPLISPSFQYQQVIPFDIKQSQVLDQQNEEQKQQEEERLRQAFKQSPPGLKPDQKKESIKQVFSLYKEEEPELIKDELKQFKKPHIMIRQQGRQDSKNQRQSNEYKKYKSIQTDSFRKMSTGNTELSLSEIEQKLYGKSNVRIQGFRSQSEPRYRNKLGVKEIWDQNLMTRQKIYGETLSIQSRLYINNSKVQIKAEKYNTSYTVKEVVEFIIKEKLKQYERQTRETLLQNVKVKVVLNGNGIFKEDIELGMQLNDIKNKYQSQLRENGLIKIDIYIATQKTNFEFFKSIAAIDQVPKLERVNYQTNPPISQLARMSAHQLQHVQEFEIYNQYGSIFFKGQTDVLDLDLDQIVEINHGEAEVYPQNLEKQGLKPPVGQKLNKPAIITLYNMHPKNLDKESFETYKESLQERCRERGDCEFIDYNDKSYEFVFKVKHF